MHTGAGPDVENEQQIVEWLESRLSGWEEPSSLYDCAVRVMISATLQEHDKYKRMISDG